jgi:hypothetical protein
MRFGGKNFNALVESFSREGPRALRKWSGVENLKSFAGIPERRKYKGNRGLYSYRTEGNDGFTCWRANELASVICLSCITRHEDSLFSKINDVDITGQLALRKTGEKTREMPSTETARSS